MLNAIENKIFNFAVNNTYIGENLIIDIGSYLSEKYGYDSSNLKTSHTDFDKIEHCNVTDVRIDKSAAWNRVLSAAREQKDVYALATVIFYKVFSPVISENDFYVKNESILLEMVELLESIDKKDAFVYFLIGRAYLIGRGVEIDLESATHYLNEANKNGIEIAKLLVADIQNNWDDKAKYSKELIKKYPTNHIVKYYYGLCHYVGCYNDENSEIDYEEVHKVFKHTLDYNQRNEDPNDLYFLQSRYILGLCYFFGKGVDKNLNIAHELFRFSGARFVPEAKYAEAITDLLLKGNNANPKYVFNLLKESALAGYLPAVRKVMLCFRVGYGIEINNELYNEYKEFFDHYKDSVDIFSDLGKEADTCPLFNVDDTILVDEEC